VAQVKFFRGAKAFSGVLGGLAKSRIIQERAVVEGAIKFVGGTGRTATKAAKIAGSVVPFVPIIINGIEQAGRDISDMVNRQQTIDKFKAGRITAEEAKSQFDKYSQRSNPFYRMGENFAYLSETLVDFFSPIPFIGWT
jgi:uncharacterized membrane protein YjjP (DUF1212 family)